MLLDLYAALAAPAHPVLDPGGASAPLRRRLVDEDELVALTLALT